MNRSEKRRPEWTRMLGRFAALALLLLLLSYASVSILCLCDMIFDATGYIR